MLTKFVSARWVDTGPPKNTYMIEAIGDDGLTYTIGSIDSDVPPWPEFLAEGGTVEGDPPPEPQPEEPET